LVQRVSTCSSTQSDICTARLPDVLADRHADHGSAKDDRLGKRAGLEQPHLVERAVIGQLVLEADRGHLALVEQRDAVVQRAVLDEHRTHQHRRAAVRRRRRQRIELGRRALDESGLEDQVLGRIADQLQLGKDDEVGALRLLTRGEHRGGVAGDVADRLVELGEGDLERIGHGRPDCPLAWLRASRVAGAGGRMEVGGQGWRPAMSENGDRRRQLEPSTDVDAQFAQKLPGLGA
jgi:hypothetical protein